MSWLAYFHPKFKAEFDELSAEVQKELRFKSDGGIWRVAFAFDPDRDAILLVAGDESGGSEKMFYRRLIEKADKRYKEHLDEL